MEGLIPALDLINNRVVRLKKGDYNQVTDYGDPLEWAKKVEDTGAQRLHLVDLDGAKARSVQHLKVLESICSATQLDVDFGGGVTSEKDVNDILAAGAKWVTVGSVVVKQPDVFASWVERFGKDQFFVGVDVRGNEVAVSGWLEQTKVTWMDLIADLNALGISNVFMTDIDHDGMGLGPSFELYKRVLETFPELDLVASGGTRNAEDIERCISAGLKGAIVGKAFLENTL